MKKLFKAVLVSCLCAVSCVQAWAFQPEKVELPQETETAPAYAMAAVVLNEDTVDGYPKNHPTYGTLFYYNNFDAESMTFSEDGKTLYGENYHDYGIVPGNDSTYRYKLSGGNFTLSVADEDAEHGKVLKAEAISDLAGQPKFTLNTSTHIYKLGTFTLVFDLKSSSALTLDTHGYNGGNIWSHRPSFAAADSWVKDQTFSVLVDGKTTANLQKAVRSFDKFEFMDMRSAVPAGTFYALDNVRIYYKPAVKVTFDYNLPDETAVVYDLNAGTSLTAWDVSVTEKVADVGADVPELYLPGYSFVGWKNDADEWVYTYPSTACTLKAVWETVKPGYNMLNGMTEKVDFEVGGRKYLRVNDASWTRSIERLTLDGKETAALKIGNMGIASPVFYAPVKLESDRKYTFVWDGYSENSAQSFFVWNLYGEGENWHLPLGNQANANKQGKWYTNQTTTNVGCQATAADGKLVPMFFQYVFDKQTDGSLAVYFDNFAVYPNYKITYQQSDGTQIDDFALLDAAGSFLTEYTPKAELLGSKRYKIAGSDEVFDVTQPIALQNADITLVAVTDGYGVTTEKVFSYRAPSETVSAGIRFRANVSPLVRADAEEYGFMAAREDMLDGRELAFGSDAADTTYSADGRKFTGKTDDGVTYTGAVNYNLAGVDIIYRVDESNDHTQFTCVLVNLDKGYTSGGTHYDNRYDVRFTVRPYVKIAGKTYYGDCVTNSYHEIVAGEKA